MKITKAETRDRKKNKRNHGMRVGSRSVFTIERLQRERAEKQRTK